MFRFAPLALILGLCTAQAFPIDINKSNTRVTNSSEFVMENVRLSNSPNMSWARFQWNPQSNSFVLVDFAPMTPSPVGLWDLSFDIDCNGDKGHTTWDLRADGSCMSGENRPCRWVMANDEFRLTYQSGGRMTYAGKFTGASLSGTFISADGRTRGCWAAAKINNFHFAPNTTDPRARRDSSGEFIP